MAKEGSVMSTERDTSAGVYLAVGSFFRPEQPWNRTARGGQRCPLAPSKGEESKILNGSEVIEINN